jgi:hypothetical protein
MPLKYVCLGGKIHSMVNRRQFVKTVGLGALAGPGIGAVGAQADALAPE